MQNHGPFTERQAALVMHQVLQVIAGCHAIDMVHGDIKPANFLLKQHVREPLRQLEAAGTAQGWLKAVDFGCSQLINGAQLHRRTGTPGKESNVIGDIVLGSTVSGCHH